MFILQMSHQFIYPIDSPMPVAVCPSFSFFTSLFSKMNLQNLAETFWKSLERSAGSKLSRRDKFAGVVGNGKVKHLRDGK